MTTHLEPVTFGERALRIEDVLALANRQAPTQLQDDAAYRQRIAKGAQFLDSLLDKEGVIYGVTTGYGDSCVVAVPLQHVVVSASLCLFHFRCWPCFRSRTNVFGWFIGGKLGYWRTTFFFPPRRPRHTLPLSDVVTYLRVSVMMIAARGGSVDEIKGRPEVHCTQGMEYRVRRTAWWG